MPPAPKRDYGLVLFDVASPKKAELLNGLLKFATFKWFINSKSNYKLILVNSSETKNAKKYPNIYTLSDLENFDPKSIYQAIEDAEPAKSNWLDAMQLGIRHLKEVEGLSGVVTLQLIFFTTLDNANTPSFDEEAIQTIIDQLNLHDMYLYIIGPDVSLPFPITSQSSLSQCMAELKVDQSKQNEVVAHTIVCNTRNSVMCETKLGVHLLINYKKSPGTQPWKVPFTFGTKLSIPAVTTKIIRKDLCLKLTCPLSKTYEKVLADDPQVKVDECDLIRGLIRHGTVLIMDAVQFKVESKRCFDILGFTDKKFMPETYIQGEDTFYVLPNEATDDGFHIFTYMVKILHESGKYAIGKRVYAAGNKPRYFVLIPNIDLDPKCFVMTGLPYAGDLVPHKSETPTEPKEKLSEDDFHRFFESLTIENKDSKAGISLGPTMMMDIRQQKITNSAAKKKVRNENLDIESLDICDHESIVENEFLENLKTTWPVRSLDNNK